MHVKKLFCILAFMAALVGVGVVVGPRLSSKPGPEPALTRSETTRPMAKEVAVSSKTPQRRPDHREVVPNETLTIPDYIQPLMDNPRQPPSYGLIEKLTPADKDLLVKLYRQQTNLADKAALTWTLGFVGDEEVVEMFKHALILQYANQHLTSGYPEKTNEELVLINTVKALGLLAAKSDAAYAFVKDGADPWFWKATVQWRSNRGRDTVGLLTSSSIQAVAESGRPDVGEFLEQLKPKDLVNRTGESDKGARDFTGAVVTAAFYRDLIQERGMEYFHNKVLTEEIMSLFEQWTATDSGKQWRAWSRQKQAGIR